MKEMNRKQIISLLILGFAGAAIGGWIYEEICVYVMYHYIYNRGMLHLPLCPIYGFGAWGLYALFHKIKNPLVYCLSSICAASVFEYACSVVIEKVFHTSFWSYRDWAFSINDRISLISSALFGLLAVFFAKVMMPCLRKCVKKGNANVWLAVSLVVLAVIAGDFVLVMRG